MKIENLIKKAQKGDKIAFNNLITFYEQDLYKIARIRLNLDDACDAVQEAIITIYKSLNKLTKISSFKSWMIKILINKCNDIYKKNVSQTALSYEMFENETNFIEDKVDNYNFDSLIKVLEYEERIIVILYYFEDFSVKEISKIIKIPEGTVKSRLSRARKGLEKNLVKNDEERRDING